MAEVNVGNERTDKMASVNSDVAEYKTEGTVDFSSRVMAALRQDNPFNGLVMPALPSSSHYFESTDAVIAYQEGRAPEETYEYSRSGNPTLDRLESVLAPLYGGDWALVTTSGMNALNSLLLGVCKSGDNVLIGNDSYRRTKSVFPAFMNSLQISESIVDVYDLNAFEASIRTASNVRLLLIEMPTNPRQRVADLEKIVEIAHAHKILVCVDSTLATPYNLQAFHWGVDFVIESATKYLGGSHDLMAGVIVGREESKARFDDVRSFGIAGNPAPSDCEKLLRSLPTLELRMERHGSSALAIAQFLESHPAIERVWYAGLESHEDYAVASKYLVNAGGLLTFAMKGGFDAAKTVVDNVKIPRIAPSLGGAVSLIEQPLVMSYWKASQQVRDEAGISGGMVRYAVGLEGVSDLIADLSQALSKLRSKR